MAAYTISIFLHILAATAWIGSMIFFATVVVPVLRRPEMKTSAPALLRVLGARFRVLGWISLGTLLMTGATNLYLRGITLAVLMVPAFWSSGFGRVLGWKLGTVGLVIVATIGHELMAGQRQLDTMERDPAAGERFRRRASLLGRVVMLLSLVILFFAVALVRGSLGGPG